jgi:hypothetical protein
MTQSLPAYFAKIGGDNPREAAYDLMGKFGTHVFLTNSCPETNEYASRVLGKVITRRANYSAGTSQSINFGMSAGNSENWGASSSFGSSHGGQQSSSNSSSGSTNGSGNNWGSNRGRGTSETENRGFSESLEFAVEPGEFGRAFQTGGPRNGNIVSGVWFQSGRRFEASGTNFLPVRFRQ